MNNIAIKKSIKNNILSDKYNVFMADCPKDLPTRIDTFKNDVPEIFKNYEYPVSSWPVIINRDMVNKLNELSVKLPELIYQIPRLYFGNDVKKIADFYFGGNEMFTEFALMCHNKHIEISSRLDLVATKKGFKVLEINTGSSIGGWQVQSFESILRKTHPQLRNVETANNFKAINTQLLYIEFLVDKVLQYVLGVEEVVNIFFCLEDFGIDGLRENSITFFNQLLKQELKKRGMTGEALSGDISSLKLSGGDLFFENKHIHSVLILSLDDNKEVPPDLFRAFIMDKIYLQDHLGISILGDKRNMALLRELAIKNKFNSQDNALILDCIPWTSIVKNSKVMFENHSYGLLELLREKKDQFVVKVANGYQGKNVFIGKFSTVQEWEEALTLSLGETHFIAQEFSDSINFLAPDSSNEWTPHKLIWGAFGFGNKYGGVWVRMSAVKTDTGVINSATGAVEAIVYENIK